MRVEVIRKKFDIQVWNSEKKSSGGHVKQWLWG